MTYIQYSTIQRCLGQLEGIGASLEENVAVYYFDRLEALSKIIEELKPKEEQDG